MLDLPNGIPSRGTFGDVFSRLDPEQFQRCFAEWTRAVAAIDGKTARRSHGRRAGHLVSAWLVSAWASANTLTLGQVKTEEKSNEITAIPRLPEMLELGGCPVPTGAMGCQKETAREIVDRGADYLPAVKENRGRLYPDVRDLFEAGEGTGPDGLPHGCAATLNKGHGRIERRECRAACSVFDGFGGRGRI